MLGSGTLSEPQVGLQVASGVYGLGFEPAVGFGTCWVSAQVTPVVCPMSLVRKAVKVCGSLTGTLAVVGVNVMPMPELRVRLNVPVLEVFCTDCAVAMMTRPG